MVFAVLPVYNVRPYLTRCVESLLRQQCDSLQIILVDDGSTDGSGALCDQYAADYPFIQTIHQSNGGLSAARNTGLARCFALSAHPAQDFVLLLDSDDFIRDDFLDFAVKTCVGADCDGFQCAWIRGTADRFPEGAAHPARIRMMTGAQALLDPSVKTFFNNKLYRLQLYQDEFFPLGKKNEDEFVFYRILWKCRRFAVTDAKMYYYFQRKGSIMDTVANSLKGDPHRYDWRAAFDERIAFFTALGEVKQVQRCYERICIEWILRYSEQMQLPPEQRDSDALDGTMVREYRACYPKMISLDTIRPLRKLIFTLFYICPLGAVIAARFRSLRR